MNRIKENNSYMIGCFDTLSGYYHKDFIMGIALIAICPLLALFYFIYQVYQGKLYTLSLISFCLALCAFITPPVPGLDLLPHTNDYLVFVRQVKHSPIFRTQGHDFVLYTMSNICAKLGIAFEYVRAVFMFCSYQISFYFYKKILSTLDLEENDGSSEFYLFIIFLCSVPFVWIVTGMRMGLACYIAAYGWYKVYSGQRINGLFFFVLSLCTHFGCTMFIPFILYSLFPIFNIDKKLFIVLCVLAVLSGSILLDLLPEKIVTDLQFEGSVDYYMKNSQENFWDTQSVNGFIAMWLERLPLIMCLILIITNRIELSSMDKSIIYFCFIFLTLTYPFLILFQKYGLFVLPVVLFLVLQGNNHQKQIKWIAIACVISNLSYFYGYRTMVMLTPYYKLLVSPIYILTMTDTKEILNETIDAVRQLKEE